MKKQKSILRYHADLIPTLGTLLAMILMAIPFVFSLAWPLTLCLSLIIFPLRKMTVLHQHNHGHLKNFYSKAANEIYDVILSLVTGFVTAGWELHHNMGHHQTYLAPERDVISLKRFRCEDGSLISRIKFTVLGEIMSYPDCIRIAWDFAHQTKSSKMLIRFFLQMGLQLSILMFLTRVFPLETLIILWIPCLFLRWGIFWVAYNQHLHSGFSSVYTACNNILSQPYSRLNVGHHTAHHEKPTLHWSLLPERTLKIFSLIPASKIRQTSQEPVRVL